MKKILFFLMALALLMFIAIPATAGPVAAPPTIESAMLPALTMAVKASMPVENAVRFLRSSPLIFTRTLASPWIVGISAAKTTIYIHAVMAILATLMGLGLAITANHLKYDIRDRMHPLPRDQDSFA